MWIERAELHELVRRLAGDVMYYGIRELLQDVLRLAAFMLYYNH